MTRPAGLSSLLLNAAALPGQPGGIANYAYHLADHLVRIEPDLDVTLVVPAHLRHYFGALPRVRVIALPFRSQAVRIVLNQLWVPWAARRFSLVHSVGNYGLLLRTGPQTLFIHDTYEKTSPERFGSFKRRLLSRLIAWTGRRAQAVLTNSRNTKKDIARHYPELADKVRVTLLGAKFPVAAGSSAAARRGFLFVGTLEPGKRPSDVLEAYARIHERHPDHPLRIVGQDGWGTSGLRENAVSLGVGDQVEFTGYVPDEVLAGLYRDSLALVQASSYEGFGLPVVEAMSCGCPVIVAENSALAEVGGDAAEFFSTGDVAALAAAMDRLASDPDLCRARSEQSLERARAFRWENTARDTLRIFRDVMDGRTPRPF